ncbi:MAG: hypothetical protein L6Q77_02010 [Bacteroidetes bacterium]|nr:hypothetical protein [Bacteroidota bacterium]
MSRSAKRPELLRQLSSITFLRALPPEEVQSLIPFLEPFHFPAGTRMMQKGDPGDSLLLLKGAPFRLIWKTDQTPFR